MDFKDRYPDYATIEEHIRRARIERSLAIAQMLADAIAAVMKGLRAAGRGVTGLFASRPAPLARRRMDARGG